MFPDIYAQTLSEHGMAGDAVPAACRITKCHTGMCSRAQVQPNFSLHGQQTTLYAYVRRAAPCGRPTRGLHAREARLHAGFGDRDVRVRHCRGPHQNQELINSADSRMLDRSSPYLTHQRIECKTRTQGPYYGGAVHLNRNFIATVISILAHAIAHSWVIAVSR